MRRNLESVCVHVLQRCNLSCAHCWSGSSPVAENELSAEAVIAFVKELVEEGLKHVSISGGEPALYKTLPELVDCFLNLGLHTTVTTNGTLTKGVVERLTLAGIQPTKKLWIRVSIDGPKNVHEQIRGVGTYSDAVGYLTTVRRWLGWVGMNTVVTHDVFSSFDRWCEELTSLQIDEIALLTPVPRGFYSEELLSPEKVVSWANACKDQLLQAGFRGRVVKWDYISTPNSYLLVEADGQVLLPNSKASGDVVVGMIGFLDATSVRTAVEKECENLGREFFSWRAPERRDPYKGI